MGNLLNLGCDCCTPPFCDLRCDPAEGETHDDTDAYASVTVSEATGLAADGINGTYAIGPEASYKMKDWPGHPCGFYIGPGIGSPINSEMFLRRCSESFMVRGNTFHLKERIGFGESGPTEYYVLGASNIINHFLVYHLDAVWAYASEGGTFTNVSGPLSVLGGLNCPGEPLPLQSEGVRQQLTCSCMSEYNSGGTRLQRKFAATIQRYSWIRLYRIALVLTNGFRVNSDGTFVWAKLNGDGSKSPVAWNPTFSTWDSVSSPCTEVWADGTRGGGSAGNVFGNSLAEVLALIDTYQANADDLPPVPSGTSLNEKSWLWYGIHDYDTCEELMAEHELTCTVPSGSAQTSNFRTSFPTYELQESISRIGEYGLATLTSGTSTTLTHPMWSHTDPIKIQLNHA